MSKQGVDLEKIAALLTESADREESYLQKIASLENTVHTLIAEKKAEKPISFDDDIVKEASIMSEQQEMGFVDTQTVLDESLAGRSRLSNWLETLA